MNASLPPYLEECFGSQARWGRWVGASDGYAPQLKIHHGPAVEELRREAEGDVTVVISFISRTDDMDQEDPGILEGEFEVDVSKLFEDTNLDAVHFLGRTGLSQHPYLSDVEIWVWSYDDIEGYADFRVD